MSAREVVATPQKVVLSVMFDVVTVEFICGDDYAAQVLYDDMLDRMRDGEGLTISIEQPAGRASLEKGG